MATNISAESTEVTYLAGEHEQDAAATHHFDVEIVEVGERRTAACELNQRQVESVAVRHVSVEDGIRFRTGAEVLCDHG